MGAFEEIAARAEASFGFRLFTVMRYLPASDEVERVHTTHAASYPTGGTSISTRSRRSV